MTKDDVALALNHVDEGHRTTDIYIDKDWGIVDEVQAGVIGLLHDFDELSNGNVFIYISSMVFGSTKCLPLS